MDSSEHDAFRPIAPDPLLTCTEHRMEDICACGMNQRCPNCGFGHGQLPCDCERDPAPHTREDDS